MSLETKKGMPKEGEIVLCTVIRIQYHCVHVRLDEYGRNGMIHIPEVAPGRIRNINDYVKVDKVIVCKVLRINEQKGYIDLSLRRVTESQRRQKVTQVKQEQIAEKIVQSTAVELKIDFKKFYADCKEKLKDEDGLIYPAFEQVVEGQASLTEFGIDKGQADKLEEIIKQRIKPASVVIEGLLTVETYAPNGVEIIREAMTKVDNISDEVNLNFLGGGHFKMIIESKDYKEAEGHVSKAMSILNSSFEPPQGKAEFIREDR